MSDHDGTFYADPVTGECSYCSGIHELETPMVQVFDRARGVWVFPLVAGDIGEEKKTIEFEPFPETIPVIEPEFEPVPEREPEKVA